MLNRAQNVFGYFTTVATVVAVVIALSAFAVPQRPTASLKLRNIQVAKGRPHYYSTKKEEYAHVRFDLDTDLSTLYNWNTKQVFLYIKAIYPSSSPNNPPSEAIIWDAILPSPQEPWHQNQYIHPASPPPAHTTDKWGNKKVISRPGLTYSGSRRPGILKLSNQKPKYVITDYTGLIAERGNATLELGWNVQPWVGPLTWNMGRDVAAWRKLKGGVSKVFDFPEVKGKKSEMGTVKGAEGRRGKPE